MPASEIFTRRKMGLDYRVWLTLLTTWLLAFILLGHTVVREESCASSTLWINNSSKENEHVYSVNETLIFKLSNEKAKVIIWDFNDGTDKVTGNNIAHRFTTPGRYKVVALINGKCKEVAEIKVRSIYASDGYATSKLEILGSAFAFTSGEEGLFYSSVDNGNSYQWMVVANNGSILQRDSSRSSSFKYRFNTAGTYTIKLIINNDISRQAIKDITVSDIPVTPAIPGFDPIPTGPPPGPWDVQPEKPDKKQNDYNDVANGEPTPDGKDLGNGKKDPAEPAKPNKPKVDEQTFKIELAEVINGKKDIDELDKYLIYGSSTIVKFNNDEKRLTLFEFYNRVMKERKKYKMDSMVVKFQSDESGIHTIIINIEKKKRIGNFFTKD